MNEEEQLKILKVYFTALREETLERVKLVSRIELGKFLVVTSVLGFAIGKGIPETEVDGMVAVFGFLPFLAFLFDCYIAFNQKMIHQIGQYVRDQIENAWVMHNITLWEHYVSESDQRWWDALGRLVHLFTTFLAIIISGIFFYEAIKKWGGNECLWLAIYMIGYFILLITDFLFLGIHKKLFKREYYA